ncbi:hypothetical protein Syun_023961 [Stephania yunnanensis]|uniref:Uncharacterized protein n=1 Tax=Stephania yunnanensis TaxID=152371 RepID=A0AAP0F9W5_9MAGN
MPLFSVLNHKNCQFKNTTAANDLNLQSLARKSAIASHLSQVDNSKCLQCTLKRRTWAKASEDPLGKITLKLPHGQEQRSYCIVSMHRPDVTLLVLVAYLGIVELHE